MRVISVAVGGPEEAFPVYAFTLRGAGGAYAKVIVVDRPTKRIVCLPVSDGCFRSCVFCASASRPFTRMFSCRELEQMVEGVVGHHAFPRIGHPVLLSMMGVGDPLDNGGVADFLRIADGSFRTALATTAPSLKSLGLLMTKSPATKVTVSLHAGSLETRRAVLNGPTCLSPRELYRALGDSVEYNYVTLLGVNDSSKEAYALNDIVGGGFMRLKLNTLNLWPGTPCRQGEFPARLLNESIVVEHYSTDGATVFGACGQCGYRRCN